LEFLALMPIKRNCSEKFEGRGMREGYGEEGGKDPGSVEGEATHHLARLMLEKGPE
jgi:hypothetical protein